VVSSICQAEKGLALGPRRVVSKTIFSFSAQSSQERFKKDGGCGARERIHAGEKGELPIGFEKGHSRINPQS